MSVTWMFKLFLHVNSLQQTSKSSHVGVYAETVDLWCLKSSRGIMTYLRHCPSCKGLSTSIRWTIFGRHAQCCYLKTKPSSRCYHYCIFLICPFDSKAPLAYSNSGSELTVYLLLPTPSCKWCKGIWGLGENVDGIVQVRPRAFSYDQWRKSR